jgi:hypothetical protein
VPISNNESACNKKITTARIQYCHWSLRFVWKVSRVPVTVAFQMEHSVSALWN